MQKANGQELQQGLVVSYFGQTIAVETQDAGIVQCHLRRNQELPLVGDNVMWAALSEGAGTIVEILPRKSLLKRGDGRGKTKALAANVEVLLVVMAPPPIFSTYLVDRYLVAAELLGLKAALVMNKIDLLTEATKAEALQALQVYQKLPYQTFLSSVYTQEGLPNLELFLKNRTGVLVGPSGVGKSSIIGALNKEEQIRVSNVSAKGIGKHTTTASRLYHLPQGGSLIDSPGVREFNLWRIDRKELLRCFPEFTTSQPCKFRDCCHLAEPGCKIKQAVADQAISASRYESYQLFMQEMSKDKC